MKKLILVSIFMLLWPLATMAQDVPKYEISVGGSDLRESQLDSTRDAPGWYVSFARNINNWFALEAEYSNHRDTVTSRFVANGGGGNLAIFANTDKNTSHLIVVGPRFAYRGIDRLTLYAHALPGLRYDQESFTFPLGTFPNVTDTTVKHNHTGFAVATGGGMDVNITKSFSIRAFQADYIKSDHPLKSDHNDLRLSSGFVFRFGSK